MRRGFSGILLILIILLVIIFLIPIPWNYKFSCPPCTQPSTGPPIGCVPCADGWHIRKPVFWSVILPFVKKTVSQVK